MDTQLLDLPMLSATQIKMFMNCRRLYYLSYRERLPQSDHIAALMGSSLHKAIEEFIKHGKKPLITFSEDFDRRVEDKSAAGTLKQADRIQELKRLGFEIVGLVGWDKMKARTDIDIERRFILPFPNKHAPIAYINGVIDLITPDNLVIDHKSSSRLPTKADMANDPQFILYRWAMNELEGSYPTQVIWHHLRTGIWHDTKVEVNFEEKLAAVITTVKEMLIEETFEKKKKDFFCYKVCDHYARCWKQQETT